MKQDLQQLLDKQVDRKDFLKHVGFGIVTLTGVTALTKSLTGFGDKPKVSGFGAGVYGDVPRREADGDCRDDLAVGAVDDGDVVALEVRDVGEAVIWVDGDGGWAGAGLAANATASRLAPMMVSNRVMTISSPIRSWR